MRNSLQRHKNDLYSDLEKIKLGLHSTGNGIKELFGDGYLNSLENIKDIATYYKDSLATYTAENPFKALGASFLTGLALGIYIFKK